MVKRGKSGVKSFEKNIKIAEKHINEVLNDESKLFAFIATFFSIVGFFIAFATKRHDRYVMYYAKQSLIIFFVYVIAVIAVAVPFVGWIIGPIIYVVGVLLWLLSWIYAISGEHKEVPIVGRFIHKLRF